MEKNELLESVCSYAGLSVEYVENSSIDGKKHIRCRLSGKCTNGTDDFSFSTLPYADEIEAGSAALTYLLTCRGTQHDACRYVPKLPVASSIEELELKMETLTP